MRFVGSDLLCLCVLWGWALFICVLRLIVCGFDLVCGLVVCIVLWCWLFVQFDVATSDVVC